MNMLIGRGHDVHRVTGDPARAFGRSARVALAAAALLATAARGAAAQWAGTYETAYLAGSFNWQFRRNFPAADRLFNAFDYGHATLYETLWNRPRAPVARLESTEFDFLTRKVLADPPRLPLAEAAIEVTFAKMAPEAKAMLDWAHVLHRQVYDVWADPSLSVAEKDGRVTALLGYYRTRPDLAFSSRPKSMDLMDGQLYSLAFRKKYPKFNGLIWAYHWLQIGLYEPLMTARSAPQRTALVDATVGRFRQMLGNPPETMPYLMPMTPAVAPTFARRYPEVAAIFDNLHMMHDVVADILTSPEIPRSAKRQEILRAAALFRSDSAYAISSEEWRQMAQTMGVDNMGGPAVGFPAALPRPTVARGTSLAGMAGMAHGNTRPAPGDSMPGMQHAGMPQVQDTTRLRAIVGRMLADPVIRERAATDPVLQRLLQGVVLPAPGGQAPGGMTMPMNMPGMQHGGVPPASAGATMPGMEGMNMGGATTNAGAAARDRRQAVEFIVRLLSDSSVAGRIDTDPELRRLWSDPDVQRRLEELRRARSVPAATPQPTSRPPRAHEHP